MQASRSDAMHTKRNGLYIVVFSLTLFTNTGTATKAHRFSIESRDIFNNFRGQYDNGFLDTPAYNEMAQALTNSLDGFFGYATLSDDSSGGGYGGDTVHVDISYNETTRLYVQAERAKRRAVRTKTSNTP